jgi:hypothetical protein
MLHRGWDVEEDVYGVVKEEEDIKSFRDTFSSHRKTKQSDAAEGINFQNRP